MPGGDVNINTLWTCDDRAKQDMLPMILDDCIVVTQRQRIARRD
jgi:hypothetical protein